MKYVEGDRKNIGNVDDVVNFRGIIRGLGTCKKYQLSQQQSHALTGDGSACYFRFWWGDSQY